MFTGIIEEVGRIDRITALPGGKRFRIQGKRVFDDLKTEDSISVNGVCLTVTREDNPFFEVTAVDETLRRSVLGNIRTGEPVNLERAMRLNDRLGGHMISGHVDGTGRILSMRKQGEAQIVEIEIPATLTKYTIEKGSVAIDGISLTIAGIMKNRLRIHIIPYSLENTILGRKRSGDAVNVEVDLLGKYVEKILGKGESAGMMSEKWLKSLGY